MYSPQDQAVREGDLWNQTVHLHVHPGDRFFVVVQNEYPPFDTGVKAEIVDIRLWAE